MDKVKFSEEINKYDYPKEIKQTAIKVATLLNGLNCEDAKKVFRLVNFFMEKNSIVHFD